MQKAPLYLALLHHSVLNKYGQSVSTAITNMDIHDISRSSHSYGLKGYYLVNPEEEQQRVALRIISHWQKGGGKSYNPLRAKALENTQLVSSLNELIQELNAREGKKPFLVMTSARNIEGGKYMDYKKLREGIFSFMQPILLVFGTGWGMEERLLKEADAILPPIRPRESSAYIHLSVRAAVAIVLDRLLGER